MDAVEDVRKFVSRTARVAVENPQSSPDTVLAARLMCAVADADKALLQELTDHISERAKNKSPFEHVILAYRPFNMVHLATVAPNPTSMEFVLHNQFILENMMPIHPTAASTSTKAAEGATALHLAAAQGKLGEIRLLLASGVDPRAQRKRNITVLHDALEACVRSLPDEYFLSAGMPARPVFELDGSVVPPPTESDKGEVNSLATTMQLGGDTFNGDNDRRSMRKLRKVLAALSAQGGVVDSPSSPMDGSPSSPTGGGGLHGTINGMNLTRTVRTVVNETRRLKLLRASEAFDACVQLVMAGADPDIINMKDGSSVTPWLQKIIKDVKDVVAKEREAKVKGGAGGNKSGAGPDSGRDAAINVSDLATSGKPNFQTIVGRSKKGEPSHQLFIRNVLERRTAALHMQRMADISANLNTAHDDIVSVMGSSASDSDSDDDGHTRQGLPHLSLSDPLINRHNLAPVAKIGQCAVVKPTSLFLAKLVTMRLVKKRLKILKRRLKNADRGVTSTKRHSLWNNHHRPSHIAPAFAVTKDGAVAELGSGPSLRALLRAPSAVAQAAERKRTALHLGDMVAYGALEGSFRPNRSFRHGLGKRTVGRKLSGDSNTSPLGTSTASNKRKMPSFTSESGSSLLSPNNGKGGGKGSRRGPLGSSDTNYELPSRMASVTFAGESSAGKSTLLNTSNFARSRFGSVYSVTSTGSDGKEQTSPTLLDNAEKDLKRAKQRHELVKQKQVTVVGTSTCGVRYEAQNFVSAPDTIVGVIKYVGTLPTYQQTPSWNESVEANVLANAAAAEKGSGQPSVSTTPQALRGTTSPPELSGSGSPPLNSTLSNPDSAENSRPGSATSHRSAMSLLSKTSDLGQNKRGPRHTKQLGMEDVAIDQHLGPERLFAGLSVPRGMGNCDGRYVGNGVRYFDVDEGCSGLFVPVADLRVIEGTTECTLIRSRLKRSAVGHDGPEWVTESDTDSDSDDEKVEARKKQRLRQKKKEAQAQRDARADWRKLAKKDHHDMQRMIRDRESGRQRMDDQARKDARIYD